jgi:hypothetical protein
MSLIKRRKAEINKLNNTILNAESLEKLNEYVNNMDNFENESTLSTIIKKYCSFNNLANSICYLNLMITKKFIPKLRTYSPIIDLLYKNDDIERIIYIYEETRKYNIKLDENDFSKILYLIVKSQSTYYNKLLPEIGIYINILSLSSYRILENILEEVNDIKLNKIDIELSLKTDILNVIEQELMKNNKNFINFKKILDYRKNNKMVILDGANIGYFNNRPDKGYVLSIYQINSVINYYKDKDYDILLILHNRHLRYTKFSNEEITIIKKWKHNIYIYETPNKFNDDLYWLYATIYLSKFTNCKLVTNDKLRDHIFSIIAKQLNVFNDNVFSYFLDNYIINYDIDYKYNYSPFNISDFTYSIQNIDINDNFYWILPFQFEKIKLFKLKYLKNT